MTKIQKAKQKEMGYVPKLIPNTCSNCSTLACEEIVKKGVFEHTRTHTTNHRCLKGGFPVKKGDRALSGQKRFKNEHSIK